MSPSRSASPVMMACTPSRRVTNDMLDKASGTAPLVLIPGDRIVALAARQDVHVAVAVQIGGIDMASATIAAIVNTRGVHWSRAPPDSDTRPPYCPGPRPTSGRARRQSSDRRQTRSAHTAGVSMTTCSPKVTPGVRVLLVPDDGVADAAGGIEIKVAVAIQVRRVYIAYPLARSVKKCAAEHRHVAGRRKLILKQHDAVGRGVGETRFVVAVAVDVGRRAPSARLPDPSLIINFVKVGGGPPSLRCQATPGRQSRQYPGRHLCPDRRRPPCAARGRC